MFAHNKPLNSHIGLMDFMETWFFLAQYLPTLQQQPNRILVPHIGFSIPLIKVKLNSVKSISLQIVLDSNFGE